MNPSFEQNNLNQKSSVTSKHNSRVGMSTSTRGDGLPSTDSHGTFGKLSNTTQIIPVPSASSNCHADEEDDDIIFLGEGKSFNEKPSSETVTTSNTSNVKPNVLIKRKGEPIAIKKTTPRIVPGLLRISSNPSNSSMNPQSSSTFVANVNHSNKPVKSSSLALPSSSSTMQTSIPKPRPKRQDKIWDEDLEFLQGFDPSKRAEKKKAKRYTMESLQQLNQPNAERFDQCDCLISDCPGCHFPCRKCQSSKCGHECRRNRRWLYETIDVEGRPEQGSTRTNPHKLSQFS